MASHQKLLYHITFSVKERRPLLQENDLREKVWAYTAGVTKNLGGFPIRIGGFYDHAHLLIAIPAKIAVANFVGAVKANTSKHINETYFDGPKFHWQDGYGAFTVSPSNVGAVDCYIANQIEHHRRLTYQEEYLELLKRHNIDYDPKYIWE